SRSPRRSTPDPLDDGHHRLRTERRLGSRGVRNWDLALVDRNRALWHLTSRHKPASAGEALAGGISRRKAVNGDFNVTVADPGWHSSRKAIAHPSRFHQLHWLSPWAAPPTPSRSW